MIKQVFLLASGHSGSTLLNLILGAHRDVAALSELTTLPVNVARNNNCTCGAPIKECAFWQKVARLLSARLQVDLFQNPYSLNLGFMPRFRTGNTPGDRRIYRATWRTRNAIAYASYRTGLPLVRSLPSVAASIHNTMVAYTAIREVSGAALVVDASKSYTKGIGIYNQDPERTRLLLLTRDGRASFYSRLRRGIPRRQSLSAWRNYYSKVLPLVDHAVPQSRILRVRYEDLASQPTVEAERICRFLNLQFQPQMLQFHETVQHSVGGNNMRFRGQQAIRLDTSWQNNLTNDDLCFFEKHAGRLNRMLGY